ncbi:MAG TPA: hypothetical protein VF219_17040, partial [Vicinamibacterales bacterium]
MKTRLLAALALAALPLAGAAQSSRVDAAFERFWAAASPAEAAERVDEVVASGVTFDDALRRLRTGRRYQIQPPGLVQLTSKSADGVEHPFAVTVPDGYDASKRYQVRVQLHGGVMNRHSNVPP